MGSNHGSISQLQLTSHFWRNPGVKTLVDWCTDGDNYKRLHVPNPTLGYRPMDVRKEIAAIVNKAEGTHWTEVMVKSRLQYLRRRYTDAQTLIALATGEDADDITNLDSRVKEICPAYDRLAPVMADYPINRAPTPRRARSKRRMIIDEDTEESSDSEGEVTEGMQCL